MDKKKATSWGVSFASLALVAGMMSYMGVSSKNSSGSKLNQSASPAVAGQPATQNGNSQNSFGSSSDSNGSSNFSDDQITDNSGSSFGSEDENNSQASSDDSSLGQDNNQLSGRGFGHHDGFDTTTGGT